MSELLVEPYLANERRARYQFPLAQLGGAVSRNKDVHVPVKPVGRGRSCELKTKAKQRGCV